MLPLTAGLKCLREALMYKMIVLAILLSYSAAYAEDLKKYTKGLDAVINLNSTETARLTLYDGYTKYTGEHDKELKGLIKITGGKNNTMDFSFTDPENDWPVYVWPDSAVNTVVSDFTSLTRNNVFDLDGNGQNEVFVYGESSHGSGYPLKKVFSFEESGGKMAQKYPVFSAVKNSYIIYYRPKKIVIIAQYIGNFVSDGDGYYEFFISEQSNGFEEKLKLAITKKRHTTEYGEDVIEENIGDIADKYDLYKKGNVDEKEKKEVEGFTEKYWELLSQNKCAELKQYLPAKIKYYSGQFTAGQVIKDKERILAKNKGLKFRLSDFLIYEKDGHIWIEYDKWFEADKNVYGWVRSLLQLVKQGNSFAVISENDTFNYNTSDTAD